MRNCKMGLVLLILLWQRDMLWKTSERQIKLVVWRVEHVWCRAHPNQNEIAHRICIILRLCGTRFQEMFCVRLAVPEDVAVLLFLLCGYQSISDALVRASSSEHKEKGTGQRKHRRKWWDRKIERVINLKMKARWEQISLLKFWAAFQFEDKSLDIVTGEQLNGE